MVGCFRSLNADPITWLDDVTEFQYTNGYGQSLATCLSSNVTLIAWSNTCAVTIRNCRHEHAFLTTKNYKTTHVAKMQRNHFQLV